MSGHGLRAVARTILDEVLGVRPDLCFIDAEHTDDAALRDARYCLAAAGPDCAIAFHDANVVYRALRTLISELESAGREFRAYSLPEAVLKLRQGFGRLVRSRTTVGLDHSGNPTPTS